MALVHYHFILSETEAHLNSHAAHDGPLVTFQSLLSDLLDLSLRLAQEELTGRLQQFVIATLNLDLDQGDTRLLELTTGIELLLLTMDLFLWSKVSHIIFECKVISDHFMYKWLIIMSTYCFLP